MLRQALCLLYHSSNLPPPVCYMPVQGSFHTTRVHTGHPSPASCHILSYTAPVSDALTSTRLACRTTLHHTTGHTAHNSFCLLLLLLLFQ